jgi:phage terminase large subunit
MTAQFPAAFDFLFEPARYKVAYGGRGAAKSWAFARALLIRAAQEPRRIVCAREIQKSIADSVPRC